MNESTRIASQCLLDGNIESMTCPAQKQQTTNNKILLSFHFYTLEEKPTNIQRFISRLLAIDPSSDCYPQETKLSCLRFIATLVSFPSSTFEVAMVVHSSICRVNHDKFCLGLLASWSIVLCDLISIFFFSCVYVHGVPDCALLVWRGEGGEVCVHDPQGHAYRIKSQSQKKGAKSWHIGFHSSTFCSIQAHYAEREHLDSCFRECINPNCRCSKACRQWPVSCFACAI